MCLCIPVIKEVVQELHMPKPAGLVEISGLACGVCTMLGTGPGPTNLISLIDCILSDLSLHSGANDMG